MSHRWLTLLTTALALAAPAPAQSELPSFKDDIDRSVRWLRAQQDRATGAYGGSVRATAWTLIALVESPRAYRRADGPFVADALDWLVGRQADDGSIADAAAADERRDETALAATALTLLFDAQLTEPLDRALGYLGEREPLATDDALGLPAEPEALAALGAKLVARRSADGSWTGDRAILETARNVARLGRIEARLKPLRPKAATPDGARALPAFEPATRDAARAAMRRGAEFLVGAQVEPGRWGAPGRADAGLTAMVVGALASLPAPRPAAVDEAVDEGLDWLVSLQHEDGSIHAGQLANYVTSASVMALARGGGEEHRPALERARAFLQGLQADGGEGYSEGDRYYGGIGYGGDERPDLSNLQMALEALVESGLESDDPTFQKALTFLERCQNRSESNDVAIATEAGTIASGDDGGGVYMPGDSKAGFVELSDGTRVPRSYGSMTYALLKCFVFCGLERSDPRVEAAWEWIRAHYTLDVNPGFEHSSDPTASYQGLFYYLNTMAQALDAFGQETIVDAEGRRHAWRSEVAGRLCAMQSRIDGSWVNSNAPRWWEGNPVLATSYALLTLAAAMP